MEHTIATSSTRRGPGTAIRGIAATAALLIINGVAVPAHAARPSLPPHVQQASTALNQLDNDFFDPKTAIYEVTGGAHEPGAAIWPTSQVLAGAIAVAQRTHAAADLARVRRIIRSLQVYITPDGVYHARTVRSLRYYDDNNWIALDLLDAYGLFKDPTLLVPVKKIFDFLVSGWDAKAGGGIIWADGHSDRPTVSTAPAITIGLRLAKITGQDSYRVWADRFYKWENDHMRASNGLYWDHIDPQGKIDKDFVSYNQGVMIDANVAYAALTGKGFYLTEARRIAGAAAAAFARPWRDLGNYAAFDAIYFHSLVDLNAASPGAADLAPVRDYLTWAWPAAHTARPASTRTEDALLQQAAFVLTSASLPS